MVHREGRVRSMGMKKRVAWIGFAAPVALFACVGQVGEDNRPCPCASGWTCCPDAKVCVQAGASCPAETTDSGASASSDGAIASEASGEAVPPCGVQTAPWPAGTASSSNMVSLSGQTIQLVDGYAVVVRYTTTGIDQTTSFTDLSFTFTDFPGAAAAGITLQAKAGSHVLTGISWLFGTNLAATNVSVGTFFGGVQNATLATYPQGCVPGTQTELYQLGDGIEPTKLTTELTITSVSDTEIAGSLIGGMPDGGLTTINFDIPLEELVDNDPVPFEYPVLFSCCVP
jgi:hypothetical protein